MVEGGMGRGDIILARFRRGLGRSRGNFHLCIGCWRTI